MAEQERYEQLLRDKIRVDLERDKARAEVERLREALKEDREKWSFDTVLFICDRLLAEAYPEGLFPDAGKDEPGPNLIRALRQAREALDSVGREA